MPRRSEGVESGGRREGEERKGKERRGLKMKEEEEEKEEVEVRVCGSGVARTCLVASSNLFIFPLVFLSSLANEKCCQMLGAY